jgi:GNAT superfamily N-acetyltransferase
MRVAYIFERELGRGAAPPPMPAGIAVRRVAAAELPPAWVPAAAAQPPAADGVEFFAAFAGDRVAHVSAVVPGGLRPVVAASRTAPEFRGRGIFTLVLRAICADLAARGIPRLAVSAAADNAPSVRAIRRAGFRLARTAVRVRIGPYRRTISAPDVFLFSIL